MAICWKGNSGYKYLKKENSALCIEKMCDIEKTLKMLVDKPEVINDVAKNVYNLAKHRHSIERIQKELYTDFIRLYDL